MAASSRGSNGAANSENSLRTAMSAGRTTLYGFRSAWTVVTLGFGSSYLSTVLWYLFTMQTAGIGPVLAAVFVAEIGDVHCLLISAEADAALSRDMIGMTATARPATNFAFIIECPSLMRMGGPSADTA